MLKQIELEQFTNVQKLIGKDWMLITAGDGDKVNTMTASWGCLGELWHKPVAICFIRPQRYTYEFTEKSDTLSLSFFDGEQRPALALCGKVSGRDMDKIRELGLDLEEGETVDVPGIRQLPLTLECKVLYQQDQVLSAIEEGCRNRYYAAGTPNENDYHTAYYGLVTKAYIVEE